MKKWILLILLLGLSACQRQAATSTAPNLEATIQAAAAATLTALPPAITPIRPSQPTCAPTSTPNLHNLFCQYDFCIGHPTETYFFDALMVKDQHTASNYAYGILMTYQPNFFIALTWRLKNGEAQPYDMLAVSAGDDVIDLNNLEVFQGSAWIVTTAPILKTASPNILPYGLTATWECGDREFAWKAYTVAEEQASGLLQEALLRFDCRR